MSYTQFADAQPSGSSTGLQAIDHTRNNLMAMRDAVVSGVMPGWSMTASGGSQPATVTYSKGTERLRGTLTWGNSGGADGNVTQAVWAYSSNSGSTYSAIGTEAITYATDGTVTAVSWS